MTAEEKKARAEDIAKNKAIALKKIKDYWPDIEQSGIDAIMANIQAETSFLSKNTMEGGPSWKNNRSNTALTSINGNMDDWAKANNYTEDEAEVAYNKLTDVQKNGVRYQADENKEGGGYGALQITVNNYGLESRSDTLNKISKTLIDPKTGQPYTDFNTGVKPGLAEGDFGLGLDLSFSYYRDEHEKPWTTGDGGSFDLNNISGHELRYNKGGINRYELTGQKDAEGNALENPKPPKHVGSAFSSYNTGKVKALTTEEQTAANVVGDAKKLVQIHDATVNVKTEVEDQDAFRVTVDGISRSFANDLKDGRFEGDDDDARSEYFKRISNAFGWSDIDQLNPEQLGIARGQVDEFFQYTKGQAYGERIGGDQSWDSLFEDMTEDKYYRSLELSQEIGIPRVGRAPKKVYAELSGNPITMQMIDGNYNTENGYDGRTLIYNEGVYDSYLANKAPTLREQISSGENSLEEVVDYLGENQTETYIIPEGEENKISQPIVDSELFPEATALLDDPDIDVDEDIDEDFEVEDVTISVAPDAERTLSSLTQEELEDYEGWLSDNPDGAFEDWNKLPAASTDASSESDEYFDLRGEGAFEESFLDKLGGVSSLIGLATGAIGLGAALKDVDIPKDPKLGPAFQQRLSESKRLAQQGLTPSELAKAHNDLDSSYATGIENIVRGSAGNRAQFMAGLGGLDVARQSALMDIAVADAGMQRQNQQKYDSMMMVNEQYEAGRQAKYQDAKFAQDTAKQAAGAALAGTSMSMIANAIGDRHLNRYNKMKTEKLMMDMGYKATKDGKSGQKQLGTDENGDKIQTSFSLNNLPGGDNYEDPNLLSAPDQAVNTKAQGTNPQAQGINPQAQVFNSPIIQPSYPNINQGAQPFQNPNDIASSLGGSTTSGLINYSNENQVGNLGQNLYDIFK